MKTRIRDDSLLIGMPQQEESESDYLAHRKIFKRIKIEEKWQRNNKHTNQK